MSTLLPASKADDQVWCSGVGNQWDSTFNPALQRLRQRVQVRALYDPAFRAMLAGKQLQALLCDSVTSLLSLHDVDAILVLNSSWYESLLEFLLHYEKPCFLANNITAGRKRCEKCTIWRSLRGKHSCPPQAAVHAQHDPASGTDGDNIRPTESN
ncbi:MAG: hypothetical protein R3C11_04705 [Planctomycetaceae bacterium]